MNTAEATISKELRGISTIPASAHTMSRRKSRTNWAFTTWPETSGSGVKIDITPIMTGHLRIAARGLRRRIARVSAWYAVGPGMISLKIAG